MGKPAIHELNIDFGSARRLVFQKPYDYYRFLINYYRYGRPEPRPVRRKLSSAVMDRAVLYTGAIALSSRPCSKNDLYECARIIRENGERISFYICGLPEENEMRSMVEVCIIGPNGPSCMRIRTGRFLKEFRKFFYIRRTGAGNG